MSIAVDKDRELVLCVRSSDVADLFAVASRRPWHPATEQEVDAWLAKATVAFLPRSIAENDRSWRHLATYAVLCDGDRVFTYRRGKSGSEARLHDLRSLGVGGHVGLEDYVELPKFDELMLFHAAVREIDEEIDRSDGGAFTFGGLIADDSTPVNAVHLGIAYHVETKEGHISVREDCLADPQWVTVEQLRADRDRYESWSQIVIEHLLGGGA